MGIEFKDILEKDINYRTPVLSEFYIGLEYEFLMFKQLLNYNRDNFFWEKHVFLGEGDEFTKNMDSKELLNFIKRSIQNEVIRVKK